jgi:hypothetical protein
MAAMRGQGTPLPDSLQCEGAWVVEDYLYLYWGSGGDVRAGPTAQFSVGAWYQGNPCVGLDADQLAGALRVDRTTLIAANRDWSLIFLGTANMPPRHGGLRATAYGFRLGDREDYLTIETNPHEGTA